MRARIGFFGAGSLRFQTDPAGTYYAWKVWGLGDCKGLGIQIKAKMHRTLLFARTCHGFWSFTAFCGVLMRQQQSARTPRV